MIFLSTLKKGRNEMKTKVLQSALAEANKIIQPIISRDALSKFNKVRFDVVGPNVTLCGTNGAIQIVCRFTGETEKDGILTLPGTYFNRFVSALPQGDVKIEQTSKSKVKLIGCENVNYSLSAGEAEDFAMMKTLDSGDKVEFDFSAATLREMLRKVMFAMSKDETRPMLISVFFEGKDGKVQMTATDGRRMAHVEKEVEFTEKFALVIPAETVKIIFSLLAKEDDADIGIAVGAERISFTAASWQVTSTVVAGKYPAWRRVVPESVSHKAKLNRNTFIEGLERAALAADLGTMRVVEVRLENGKVTFAAKNEITSARVEIPNCVIEDGAVKAFKVDPQLVIDALKAIDDDSFTLEFNDDESPIVLKCSIPWLAVVMPMWMK